MIKIIDISAEVMLQNQKSQNKVLEMINATVSHELRNPLNSIKAINIEKGRLYNQLDTLLGSDLQPIQIIRGTKKILKKLKKDKEVQDSSTEFITFIIQDLLDYAQIKSQKFRKNLKICNIKKCIREVISLQKLKADANKIKILAKFENFSGPNKYNIVLDENRIKQVMLNLQSNALKYIKTGHILFVVKLLDSGDGQYLQVCVQDTGIGIKPENMAKLFKLFGYIGNDDTEINKHGIGLGLVISQKIVKEFEGDVTVESELGKGSKFTFTMKIYELPVNGNINSQSDLQLFFKWIPEQIIVGQILIFVQNLSHCILDYQIRGQSSRLSSRLNQILHKEMMYNKIYKKQLKILVVDDEAFNCMANKIILTSAGVQNVESVVTVANNGQQAVDIIMNDVIQNDDCSFDLILMDFNMPMMNGCEATEQIRKHLYQKDILQPIICCVTGQMDNDLSQECYKSGMNLVYSKPLEVQSIKNLISLFNYG